MHGLHHANTPNIRLNESPSEKEGKLHQVPGDYFRLPRLNESPSEKEGKSGDRTK